MPICPYCGKKITYVEFIEYIARGYRSYAVSLIKDELDYEMMDEDMEIFEEEWQCPECEAKLPFKSEEEVKKFLRGELKLEEEED